MAEVKAVKKIKKIKKEAAEEKAVKKIKKIKKEVAEVKAVKKIKKIKKEVAEEKPVKKIKKIKKEVAEEKPVKKIKKVKKEATGEKAVKKIKKVKKEDVKEEPVKKKLRKIKKIKKKKRRKSRQVKKELIKEQNTSIRNVFYIILKAGFFLIDFSQKLRKLPLYRKIIIIFAIFTLILLFLKAISYISLQLALRNGKIIFINNSKATKFIYSQNLNGSGLLCLTDEGGAYALPSWSPDGKKVIYLHGKNISPINFQLYVMDSDGKNKKQLTVAPEKVWSISWSKEGGKYFICFKG